MTTTKKSMKATDMAYIALLAVLIVVCSWLSIPAAVPFTMQTFAVFLAVGLLGGKRGTMAVLIYLLLGAVGIPVFAGFQGGLGYMLGATGGYIIGFLFSALVMWALEPVLGQTTWGLLFSMILGLLICYLFGTLWFMAVYAKTSGAIGLMTALGWCVFPYIIPDLLKILLAIALVKRLKKHVGAFVTKDIS